ncbi:hypothetical protein LTR28_010378 [Elasticomyces elasticus]|nr:hypothetical protein LTR28_010378 [Elasticomyces elasticus]
MDVRQWLASTMEAERPKSLTALGFPDFLRGRADAQNAETVDRQNDHKRRWTASGSSILEVAAPRKHRGHRGHETSRDRKRHRGGSDSTQFVSTCPSQSSSPSLGSSTQNRQPAKTYERKARHKTRTDRYEPKIDTSKRRTARREKKSTEKRRKTKKTRENLSTGLVQSFHAKNVPKNRLTLKPSANLGIFKKGRASSPRRGRGLPDLVFSEMRFLQKPKEQPEEQQNAPASKHKNKKDRKRVEEEEISAFFGPKKSAPGQQAHAIPAKRVTSRRHASVLSQQSDSLARSDVKPKPIRQSDELPEKQFLGFGSKGAKPDSAGSLPWSADRRTFLSNILEDYDTDIGVPHEEQALRNLDYGQSEMQQFLEHRLEEPPPQPLFYDEHELLGEPHLTDFVYDHPVQAADTQVQDYHAVQEEEPLRNEAQVEQSPELSREDYSRAEDDVDDVFAGFWRPHKLY